MGPPLASPLVPPRTPGPDRARQSVGPRGSGPSPLCAAGAPPDPGSTMFLKSTMELPMDFELVRAAIAQPSRQWIQGPAADAGRYGRRVLVDVGLEVGGHPLSRSALVEIGEPVATGR